MHADVVGTSWVRFDRFGVDVFEELKSTMTIWGLEHRDIGVVAIKADGSVGPLAADRVTADDRKTEISEKGDCCFEVANGDTDVLKFDGHALKATKADRPTPVMRRHYCPKAGPSTGTHWAHDDGRHEPELDAGRGKSELRQGGVTILGADFGQAAVLGLAASESAEWRSWSPTSRRVLASSCLLATSG